MKLIYHQDAGHGWLEVPLKTVMLAKTDVTKLSQYSYLGMKGFDITFYLEEDCDMSVFLDAAKAAGIAVQLVTKHHDHDCFVRKLAHLPDFAEEVKKLG